MWLLVSQCCSIAQWHHSMAAAAARTAPCPDHDHAAGSAHKHHMCKRNSEPPCWPLTLPAAGYIGSLSLLEAVVAAVGRLRAACPSLTWVCDPVMGDAGRMYVAEDLVQAFRDKVGGGRGVVYVWGGEARGAWLW